MSKTRPYLTTPDLREVIHPGDRITHRSTGEARTAAELARDIGVTVRATGTAVKVYPRFVMVKLKEIQEAANRWDIIRAVSLNEYSA